MTPLDIVSLQTAKDFLKVDFSDDDAIITGLIYSAVALVESKTQYRLWQRVEQQQSDGTYNVDLFQTPLNKVTVLTQEGNPVPYAQIKREPVRTSVWFRQNSAGPTSFNPGFTGGFGDGLDGILGGWGNGGLGFCYPSSLPLYNINIDCGYVLTVPVPNPNNYQPITNIPYPLIMAVKTIISYTYENRDMALVDLPSNIMMELEPYNQNPMF